MEPALMLPSPAGPAVLEKSTMPPASVMNCALPPVLLSLNCVTAPLFVVMVALPAVLLLLDDSTAPLLLAMTALPAELAVLKVRVSVLIKLGGNAGVLTIPVPLTSNVIPVPLVVKLKAGAPAVNWIVLIEASSEIVTDVGAALLVNVAVLSGTSGVELQFVPSVHSVSGPVQVPSTACAPDARVASAASETPARSATRSIPPLARAEDTPPDRQCCRVPVKLAPPSRSPAALNESNAEHLIVAPHFSSTKLAQ